MRRLNARSPEIDHLPSMDSSKPQTRAISSHRLSFSNPKSGRGNIWIFVAAVVVILAVFFYLSAVTRGSGKKGYGIVIDAGSTGTRIHVFEFSMRRGLPVLKFGDGGSATMKVNPGLSDFVADPSGAGRSILELLKFGKGRVPKEFWEETEVRLLATAGLRRLGVEIQERILDSCRRVLRSSGFRFRDDWASVITGSDEGIYAWVAANYALGTLGGDPQQTTGIVELGGASAQVTFVSSEPLPPEYSHTLKFGEFSYKLYSHSLLHLGQNVAYESLRELLISGDMKFAAESVLEGTFIDPCTPRGYSHDMESLNLPGDSSARSERLPSMNARGNFSECRSAALKLLQKGKDECLYQNCHIGSTFVPELQGKLLATENFFYTSKFFGLAPTALLSDLTLAGQQFCEEDWVNLKKIYHTLNDEDLMRYCFSSAYIVALLHDSLGIALNDERIAFANQVGDIPLDWAVGAFIMQSAADSGVEHPDWVAGIVGDDSSALLSLFIVSVVLVSIAWSVSRWQKPQLKTIYDLEKGRYIVTRVNR
ncbi:probable apyrase 6 isoform X2 [Magnolia sinica]|uniref:probable apyrase 6 isoform X2 n=1 Tax=Magnolia sinica TaxID=86752 RepID=UPI002657B74A|nr:probable apyrase 6 isoform X2 [Magnolia sinica]